MDGDEHPEDEFDLARQLSENPDYYMVTLRCGTFPVIEWWDNETGNLRVMVVAHHRWRLQDAATQARAYAAQLEAEAETDITVWKQAAIYGGSAWVFEDV